MITLSESNVLDDTLAVWNDVPGFAASDDSQFFYTVVYRGPLPSNPGNCIAFLKWTDPENTDHEWSLGGHGIAFSGSGSLEIKTGTTLKYKMGDYSSVDVGLHDMTFVLKIAVQGNY